MSSPNKVTRLWEGVGVGVLVEVVRDEWKQERRGALVWLQWPEHLNPLLSLSNIRVALGCLASKDVLTHGCSPSMEGTEGLSHPSRSCILGHSPPRLPLPWGQPAAGTGESREALGSHFILTKSLERTQWDLEGGIAKCSPKIWLSTVPVWHFRRGWGGFFLRALHWPHTAPLKPTVPTSHWELQKPQPGVLGPLVTQPCQMGALLLSCGICWASKVGKEEPQGKAGDTKGEEPSPVLHAPVSALAGNFCPWLEKDAKAPFCSYKSCF